MEFIESDWRCGSLVGGVGVYWWKVWWLLDRGRQHYFKMYSITGYCFKRALRVITVRYHSGGSMKLNACNLLLANMVYL
jgi:hypothetical protein